MNKHDIPTDFRRCVASGCAAAERCLRYQAYEASTETDASFWCINPKSAKPEEGEACPHFCSAEKVRMARGFKQAMLSVPYGNVGNICREISQHFCERNYYHMRRGDRPITPREQQIIADALAKYGASTPIEFDAYYYDFLWT